MLRKIVTTTALAMLLFSCGSGTVKNSDTKSDYTVKQTSAVFKNAEIIFGDEWKIIFRKLDDYQYILFSNSVEELNSFRYRFIVTDENMKFTVSPDYMNVRFDIDYIETTVPDPLTGESVTINRIVNITRTPGDRYSAAGIASDVEADEFIMNLKSLLRNNSAGELAANISYPVTVYVNKKKTKITDQQTLVKYYGQVFNSKVSNALLSQSLGDIQADSRGLIIGRGELRIALVEGRLMITEINNR